MTVGAVRAKGIAFWSFLTCLERVRGIDDLKATLAELPREIASALEVGEVVATGWYPIAWYRELHAAMNRACRQQGFELSQRIGRDSALADFRGIYRLLMRVISSEMLVSQAPRLFRLYFEGGEVGMAETGKGLGVIEFSRWYGFDRAMWSDVTGGIEGVLIARRAMNVRHRVLRGGADDGTFKIEYRWTMTPSPISSTLPPPRAKG
jgi:hypothetical protein